MILLLATLRMNDGNWVLSSRRTLWLRVFSTLCITLCLIFPLFAMEGMGILLILFHCMLVEYLGEYGNEYLDNGKGWNYAHHRTFYLIFSFAFFLVFATFDGIRYFASEDGSLYERIVKCTVFSSTVNRRHETKPARGESGRVGDEVVKNVSPTVGIEVCDLIKAITRAQCSVDALYGEGSFVRGFETMKMDRGRRHVQINVRVDNETSITLRVGIDIPASSVHLTTNDSHLDTID